MDDNNNQAAMPVMDADANKQPQPQADQPTGGAADTPATDAGMPTAPLAGATPVTPSANPTSGEQSQPAEPVDLSNIQLPGEATPAAPATDQPAATTPADTTGESGSTDGQPGM